MNFDPATSYAPCSATIHDARTPPPTPTSSGTYHVFAQKLSFAKYSFAENDTWPPPLVTTSRTRADTGKPVSPPVPCRSGTLTNTAALENPDACVVTLTHSRLLISTDPPSSQVLTTFSFVTKFVTSEATNIVGADDGTSVGAHDGTGVGDTEGKAVGLEVGTAEGTPVGLTVGSRDGPSVGKRVGADDGKALGAVVGDEVGNADGTEDGRGEGLDVGDLVGDGVGLVVGLSDAVANTTWQARLPGAVDSPITKKLMPSRAVCRTSSSRHWSSCAFRVAPDDVRSRTRTLVASRRLLHVVTEPNTPGTSAAEENDAPANDMENVSCVVSAKVAVIIDTDDSAQPNDTPLSYTMYPSVSASGNT